MLVYYGYTISPNQIETGEGFLICGKPEISRQRNQPVRQRSGRDSDCAPF